MVRPAELERDFGLSVAVLRPHAGGYESDCWVADDAWFVKMWKQPGKPNGLELLGDLQVRGWPTVAPIRTTSGKLYAVLHGRPYAVFPYIHGRTATHDDWRVTAEALRQVHELSEPPDLPRVTVDEPEIRQLAQRLDHPWIVDRRDEVAAAIRRLDEVIGRVSATPVREVVCHRDFGALNLMLDEDGEVAAILDWEQAVIGPREYDVWIAAEGNHLESFLTEYGAHDLELHHLEYALLARGLRDMAARILDGVDRPGVDTWGFDRIARLDRDLTVFSSYCRPADDPH
ncbi:phosphotransferase [Kribbella sp. NPDC026596]|uniref:phosphotransferase enzyme family protein n=1 Tax=Kribbella sp. NPDC026596 TaxID=3155122 RepID=UPI0033D50A53